MDEKKQELLQWLDKLEQYAGEINLSSRILDRIKECKSNLYKEGVEIGKIQHEVEEVLKSIEKKALAETANLGKKENGITLQEVQAKVKKIVQRCHEDNEEAIDGIADQKNAIVKKCDEQLKKIVQTDEHMEELKQEAQYLQFYENIALEYEKESSLIVSEMLEDMEQNYTHMVEHMKGTFRNIDGFGAGKVGEKSFYELDVKREAIGKKIQSELEIYNEGRNVLLSFARKTAENIKKIVKKAELKKKIFGMIPVLIIAMIFIKNVLTGLVGGSPEADAVNGGADANGLLGSLEESVKILKALKQIFQLGKFAIFGVLIFIVILVIIVLLCRAYLKMLKKQCDSEISKGCAEYLQNELIDFERNGSLGQALEDMIRNVAKEYEQQHVLLLNDIFAFPNEEAQDEEKDELSKLIEEWNKIK